ASGPRSVVPRNAAVLVPTPSIGLMPLGTSSTYTPGARYSGIDGSSGVGQHDGWHPHDGARRDGDGGPRALSGRTRDRDLGRRGGEWQIGRQVEDERAVRPADRRAGHAGG